MAYTSKKLSGQLNSMETPKDDLNLDKSMRKKSYNCVSK